MDWRVLAAVALASSGCGDTNEVPETFHAGSRLAPVYYHFDETKQLRHWFDTERDEACEFGVVPEYDGASHCLPQRRVDYRRSEHTLFSDDACSAPLFLKVDDPTAVVLQHPADTCNDRPRLFRFAATETFERSYALRDGVCEDYGDVSAQPLEEIPLSAFVAAIVRPGSAAEGMASAEWVATDGARQLFAGYDSAHGDVVTLWGDQAEVPWQPIQVAYSVGSSTPHGDYADSSCSVPAASKYAHSARCPITTVVDVTVPYDDSDAHFLAGRPLDPEAVFAVSDVGACVAAGARQGEVFVAQLPGRRTLHEAVITRLGDARISEYWGATPSGQPIAPRFHRRFVDTLYGVTCEVVRAADGTWRCLPAEHGLVYADPSCSEPLLNVSGDGGCRNAVRPALLRHGNASNERHDAYRVLSAHAATSYYSLNSTGCVPRSNSEACLFALEKMSPGDFVRAHTRTAELDP